MVESGLADVVEEKKEKFPVAIVLMIVTLILSIIDLCVHKCLLGTDLRRGATSPEIVFSLVLPEIILLFPLAFFLFKRNKKALEITAIVYAFVRLFLNLLFLSVLNKSGGYSLEESLPIGFPLILSVLWTVALIVVRVKFFEKSKILFRILWTLFGILGIIFSITALSSTKNVLYFSLLYKSNHYLSFTLLAKDYHCIIYLLTGILDLVAGIMLADWIIHPYKVIKEKTEKGEAMGDQASGYFSLLLHILLSIFTVRVWYFIWTYRTTKFLNSAPNVEQYKPVRKILLCIFVPFYQKYWYYKHGERLDLLAKERGLQSSNATLCLIFGIIFPFVATVIMQSGINKISKLEKVEIVEKEVGLTQQDVPEQLKKYKQLLDEGIITEEEFSAKKSELLGL